MSTKRIRLDMSAMEVAEVVAGLSRRAHEITIASCLRAADIDPYHFGGALSTCLDLDGMGIYDYKIVDLFDRVCCGCHVNLRTRIRARNMGLVGEEGFWAPDLSVEYYLKLVQRRLPRFAKDMPLVTSRQKVAEPPTPPTPEQTAESAAIVDAAHAPPADLGPRYQARMWMSRHDSELAEACGPVRGTAEEAERDLYPYRGNVMVEQNAAFILYKYVHGDLWTSMTPPEGFVLS